MALALLLLVLALPGRAMPDAPALRRIVAAELKRLQVPSASVAVVSEGRIAFAEAFGQARLDPPRRAEATMRYAIGSVSKQFLAVALLMLQEEGRLSLDDPAGKYLAGLGPAAQVTLRQLLSHTGGVQDYWPQDYVFERMLRPIEREELLATWARRPLDFTPGSQWQYSNTGYVMAGAVLEQVAGEPLFGFLKRRIFDPLGMHSVLDFDTEALADGDATGTTRVLLGPLVPAVRSGRGWLFAAGALAMTAEDLARWDLSLIERRLIKSASYDELARDTLLTGGAAARYALGLGVRLESGRLAWSHSGGVSGFTSMNLVYPAERLAVVVLTNSDAADAGWPIAQKLSAALLASAHEVDPARQAQARNVFEGLRHGRIDRSLLSDNANAWFTPLALRAIARSLGGAGAVRSFEAGRSGWRGGMDFREYSIKTERRAFNLVTRSLPDGRLEQYFLMPD